MAKIGNMSSGKLRSEIEKATTRLMQLKNELEIRERYGMHPATTSLPGSPKVR